MRTLQGIRIARELAPLLLIIAGWLVLRDQLLAQEGAFTPLLSGDNLAGWHGDNPHTTSKAPPDQRDAAIEAQQPEFLAHWRVEGNELINDGRGPYATTDKEYGDIELVIDYKTVAQADSGIYLRGTPQVQIWDTTEAGGKWDRDADKGSGGLFNNRKGAPGQLPLVLADKPFGEWNHFRIVQIGSRTWVELNGKLVVDGALMENYWDKDRVSPLPASGPIHLQTHGGEIRWRDMAVREITGDEAIQRLRGNDTGFTKIFNGQNLSGWAGATGDYEVRDGAIVCKPGKGGVLYSEEIYDDFVVRLEFKLPPGGNNGLAIRYPGQGRAAYDGMCELQILDDDAPQYATLDPRQYHGSVYGVVPAHRGYLRPSGQWNYQEVTVRGSTIRVELNGTVIVDADVAQVSDYKDDAPHPGLALTRGHFGFAGHNDPVMFRNIAIRPLGAAPQAGAPQATADTQPADTSTDASGLQAANAAMLFHASFDGTTDANLFGRSNEAGWIYTAESAKRTQVQVMNRTSSVRIAEGQGRYGDALSFRAKTDQVLFYRGSEMGYREKDWSGSVSLWLKLDPNEDLEPGFCDPIQITERGWNDGAFFVDFDKVLPRDFRLGVFPDYHTWNPSDTKYDDIPADQRPMVTVKHPPFSASEWTHVCFTWEGINGSDNRPATASLYLNGQLQGTIERQMRFTWDPDKAAIMLGLNYIGLMDDLIVFRKPLSREQVDAIYKHPRGGLN